MTLEENGLSLNQRCHQIKDFFVDLVWIAECMEYQCGTSSKPKSYSENIFLRIIGGERSEIQRWPWMASLQAKGMHQCGGTIISNRYLLTVAHCFDDIPSDFFQVFLGSFNLKPRNKWIRRYLIKQTIIHE